MVMEVLDVSFMTENLVRKVLEIGGYRLEGDSTGTVEELG
jgi:hypothetical protein